MVAHNEQWQNLRYPENRDGWNQLFCEGEADVRSVVARNVHRAEGIGRLLMFGPLTEYLDIPSLLFDQISQYY